MLFGHKTVSWFDAWSLQHTMAGFILFVFVAHRRKLTTEELTKLKFVSLYATVVMLELCWELIEWALETGRIGTPRMTYWFQGEEYWANRFISDPLILTLCGGLVWFKWPWLLNGIRLISLMWLAYHVMIFKHCMQLHRTEPWIWQSQITFAGTLLGIFVLWLANRSEDRRAVPQSE